MSIIQHVCTKLIKGAIAAWAVVSPPAVYAQGGGATIEMPGPLSLPSASGLNLATGDLAEFIVAIINAALGLLGIVVIILFLYNAFKYMTAGGNSGQVQEAQSGMVNTVIGLLIIAGAWVVSNFLLDLVTP
ncbi:MAG: hypothetical protein BRC23_02530 [Parcubacteria group bacterium SW_4_49_11]|nr:MAG: hypothetical protein BRC23_02530 [Parcubacteria group bacterium SW_4_49_11]